MSSIDDNEVEACAVGIKADGGAGMALGPVLHELAILHDDVVAATDELTDVHILRAIVELEAETDVQHIAHVHPIDLVGIGTLEPQDSLAVRDGS